ncbi:uncharacterized protein [Lolium perenne]|uniref:uncharacterized protein n=1 Tax=Lolium perenne TaxID=4522 RepID=UPI003A99FD68
MSMAASLLTAAPSLLSSASRRRRPFLAAPTPSLRLRVLASSPLARESRAACTVALARGGGEATEEERDQAPDWRAPAARLVLGALIGSAALLGCGAALAAAAEDSIRASGFGLRVGASLRRLGWPDDAVVFTLATLPVLELRGAIPAGYWMRLHPVRLTVLAVLGPMRT